MISRRHLVQFGLGAGAALGVAPATALAAAHRHSKTHHHGAHHPLLHRAATRPSLGLYQAPEVRRLSVHNIHTEESLDAVYWEHGEYVPDALEAMNAVLRDFRTGKVRPIHPNLLDAVVDLRTAVGADAPFQVVSGYRSAQTNAMLREQSAEVAKHSLHMDGMAIDLYLDDVDLERLHSAALDLSRGGVGVYPKTGFIHMDVGPLRHWQGV